MTAAPHVSPRTVASLAVAVLALGALRLALPPPTEPTSPAEQAPAPAPVEQATERPPSEKATGSPPGERAAGRTPAEEAAMAAARSFLDAHVTDDGRVVRHDEGGDTVSEGQAWALVLAVALEDQDRATAIVDWTEDHLARDDGMLSWRWDRGRTVDAQPASDADLVYAWALSRGARTFQRDGWQARADELVARLASTSTIATDDGPLLAAGPWARDRDPAVVNPSYLWDAPLAWAEQQDEGLAGAREAAAVLMRRLVDDDTPLVPDWVTVDDQGTVAAIGRPAEPDAPAVHGLDAVRTWIWLASSCEPELRELAARAHDVLPPSGQRLVAVHDLAGAPTVDWQHAATLSGAAAAAHAAGAGDVARDRLDEATRLNRDHPSYYGSAVTALARMLLDTDLVTSCDI